MNPTPPTDGERTSQSDIQRELIEILRSALEDIGTQAHCISKSGPATTPTLDDAWIKFDELSFKASHALAIFRKPRKGSTCPKGVSSTASGVSPSKSCGSTNAAGGSSPVGGSVSPQDWTFGEVENINHRMLRRVFDGSGQQIGLLHDFDAKEIVAAHNASLRADGRAETGEATTLRQVLKDECENEDEIRKLAAPIVGTLKAYGDSYGVPTTADVVESLIATLRASSKPEPVSSPASHVLEGKPLC